jgi:hypothetical protein
VRIIANLSDDTGKRRPVQLQVIGVSGMFYQQRSRSSCATTFSMQIVDKNFAVCNEGIVLESMLIPFHYVSF